MPASFIRCTARSTSSPIARPRAAVKAIVGEEAERIAWLWCAIRRNTIDGARRTVQLRRDDSTEPLTAKEVVDLATLWAADTVEQVKRMAPEERSFARGLGAILGLASPPAQDAVAALGPAWEG